MAGIGDMSLKDLTGHISKQVQLEVDVQLKLLLGDEQALEQLKDILQQLNREQSSDGQQHGKSSSSIDVLSPTLMSEPKQSLPPNSPSSERAKSTPPPLAEEEEEEEEEELSKSIPFTSTTSDRSGRHDDEDESPPPLGTSADTTPEMNNPVGGEISKLQRRLL